MRRFLLLIWVIFTALGASAQQALPSPDSLEKKGKKQAPSKTTAQGQTKTANPYPVPKKAAIRSAILPGWGQAYNKKYWKIPIVYAGLGITGGILISNINLYKDINYALDVLNNKDTANFVNVDDALKPLLLNPFGQNTLVNYRAETRRNIDYSVLAVLLIWGLNVVDATVDAHLKSFDISNQLSLQLKPNLAPAVPGGVGLGLVLDIHKAKPNRITK